LDRFDAFLARTAFVAGLHGGSAALTPAPVSLRIESAEYQLYQPLAARDAGLGPGLS
jgi:hypothetical protein